MNKIVKPAIEKNLVISTRHITKIDNNMLDGKNKTTTMVSHEYETGMFVYVPSDPDALKERIKNCKKDGFSKTFIHLIKEAHRLNCHYLQLDNAGEEYLELKSFNW